MTGKAFGKGIVRVADDHRKYVFINCPFDKKYAPILDAIVFAVFDCGFVPRSALELDDGSVTRIDKILKLILACPYGIHDISRTQPDNETKLPRFNMPFELGLFLGAKAAGNAAQKKKVCLILDVEKYRYQKFISDIAGQDLHTHENVPKNALIRVRNWLDANSKEERAPGGEVICEHYERFLGNLPKMMRTLGLSASSLTFNDYTNCVSTWLEKYA